MHKNKVSTKVSYLDFFEVLQLNTLTYSKYSLFLTLKLNTKMYAKETKTRVTVKT